MRKIATACMLFIGQLSFAQIQIVSADLPQSGEVLYQENATWTWKNQVPISLGMLEAPI